MDRLPRSGSRLPPSPSPSPSPSAAGRQHPPHLIRCNSENPAASSYNKSNTNRRSRSTTAKTTTLTYEDAEVNNFMIHSQMTINTKKKPAQDNNIINRKKPTSPSAWALSPGRPAPACSMAKSPNTNTNTNTNTNSGIGGVLKYFRPKKVASLEEADRRCFKLMNNRLLQWRFANATGEATMSTLQIVAQKKILKAWMKILGIRNSNMAKRMEVQKLQNDIKLYRIINSQLFLLQKWSRLEAKNFEAVGRVVRKLSVASLNIPLLDDSKGDVLAICDVFDKTARLLENIESTITRLYHQAENSCYQLTELSIIAKQEKEGLTELQTWMLDVASLKEKETSLRALIIQGK